MQKVVAITGGIGSGKSVVSSILRSMGYKVYDSDTEAKMLMDKSAYIKVSIQKAFGKTLVNKGIIDRKRLSEIVFSEPDKLKQLNLIVHGTVIRDFSEWVKKNDDPVVFIETAILYESGLDKYVSDVWEVTAPENIRIERVKSRNNISEDKVKRIIGSQKSYNHINTDHYMINNDGETALLPQIICLLDKL